MLARPLEIRSSPQALAPQGTIAFVIAMIANEPNRVLQPSPRSGRPIALTITASALTPHTERRRSTTVGLMSWTATLISRKETPQMSASPASARYGFRLDTRRPLVCGQNEGDGPVVFDPPPHDSSKAAGLGLYSAVAELLHEDLVQLHRALRIARLEQAGPAAAAPVGEGRELPHEQSPPVPGNQPEVHPPCLVREHAEVDGLVRQAPHSRLVVIRGRTNQQHEAGSDGCTALRSSLVPPPRARSHPLRDDSQILGPNCGSACMSESM